jgi:hypothetical protein
MAMAGRVYERKHAGRITDDGPQGVGGKPDVERERDCARAHGPEEKLDEFRSVADQHGNTLTGADAEPREQPCDGVHAGVELPIGRATLATTEQIDDGDLVRHPPERIVEEIAEVAAAVLVLHADHDFWQHSAVNARGGVRGAPGQLWPKSDTVREIWAWDRITGWQDGRNE